MENVCDMIEVIWRFLISLAGTVVVACFLVGLVLFAAELLVYRRKRRSADDGGTSRDSKGGDGV
ncbi:MAG: hypothetical protein LUD71_05720 [Clostridiales bacterium]|nr:hypothetical protein [Clostridiales bacterium]